MFNGLQQISAAAQLVAVHDSARPLITAADATKCFVDAAAIGAAVLGVRHRVRGGGGRRHLDYWASDS